MANSYNAQYDQLSAVMAEEFLDAVSDNVFVSNLVFANSWDEAERRNEGRTLNIDLMTGKNQTATAFGQNDADDSLRCIVSVDVLRRLCAGFVSGAQDFARS